MKKMKILLIIIVVITCAGTNVSGIIIFDSDDVIQHGDFYTEQILVYDASSDFPTTLEMTGGVINGRVFCYDRSTFSVSDGQIHSGLYSYENSTINISGWGDISDDLIAYDLSTINIYAESPVRRLRSRDQSVVNISGGYVAELEGYSQSTINIAGGSIDLVVCYGDNISNIGGGEIGYLYAEDSSIINIYGYGFAYEHYEGIVPGREGYLTGFWQDGTAFTISLATGNDVTYDHLNLHVVPEPGTVFLLGFGCLALRRRRVLR